MKVGDITPRFVSSRYQELRTRWGTRNERMDDYERLYLLDMWEEAPEPDDRRISVPVAFNVVESFRTLLLTRPPVISVPASEVKSVETDRADMIEKYLYGVWYQARVMDALNLAEWNSCCLGEGVLRCVYDAEMVEGELPIVVQALDPRTVYATPSGREGQDLEVVHAFEQTRREIEAGWEVELSRPEIGGSESVEEWLDEEVDFIDYWRVDVEEVEVEEEEGSGWPQGHSVGSREYEGEQSQGVLARLVTMARKALQAGAPAGSLEATGVVLETPESSEESGEEGASEREGGGEGETGPRMRKVRRRVVTNCIVVEEQFVKEPVKMPGYHRLPFIRYPGIATGLADENGALSVLFAITGGERKNGAVGLVAAVCELVALKQRIIEMYAHAAIVTDDDKLDIDFGPGAVNYVRRGSTWGFLVPPGPHPAIDGQVQLLERLTQDATVSGAMMGRYQGDISGIALSAINNPVLMRIAHRQQVRERAYEALNDLILELTEEYAPVEGWYVWGQDRRGGSFELQMRPEEINGYHRNRVELSASLPKDEAGEIMGLANLVQQKLISRETFLDQLQRIKSLSSQSPQDEMKRILRDLLLFEGPTAEKLAQVVLADYSEELAEALKAPPLALRPQAQPAAGPGPGAGPPGGPPGMGPMMGMPPGVVPPQAVPEAVGAGPGGGGGMESLAAMLAMQGGGRGSRGV